MLTITDKTKCVIETNDGPVWGYIDQRQEGTYYKFKSIPYAKPPVGNRRFLPPSPITPWTSIIDCTKDAPLPLCFSLNDKIVGSEDCLYIEVSTPTVTPDNPLPVMFWLGSYGFSHLIDNIFDPTLINNQDVVYVRCGFRLGPFGFLSINEFTAPGNCGLKDIVMALKWVQRNISMFGGNPNNVTIFGNSSGGALVHFMTLSPMAAGLFHKAVIQSVSALNNWSLDKNPSQPVMELAKELNIKKLSKLEVVEELRAMSAEDIMKAFFKIAERFYQTDSNEIFDAIFKPCIEVEFEGQSAFLTKSPPLLLKAGNFNKVPLLIGSNNIEGSLIEYVKKDFYDDFEKYNKNTCLLVPKSLAGRSDLSHNIGQQLLRFYLGGEEQLTEATRKQYVQLLSDYYFLYYIQKTVKLHCQMAPQCPIYYYILNYAGEWSVPSDLDFFNSVGHYAEIPFIFQIKMPGLGICKGTRDCITTRKRVVKMWTNFAKYGDPTPDEDDPLLQIKWDPVVNEDKLNYLSIGSELTKGRNPFQERMLFWEDLHKEHMFLRTLVYFNDMGVSC